jgi:hypothetical protein
MRMGIPALEPWTRLVPNRQFELELNLRCDSHQTQNGRKVDPAQNWERKAGASPPKEIKSIPVPVL